MIRQTKSVDKEEFKPGGYRYKSRNDHIHGTTQDDQGNQEGIKNPFVGDRVFPEIIDKNDGRNGQEVQQVYPDRQSHQVGDKDQPAVGMRFIRHIFPFQDRPENQCSQKGGGGVYFPFDRRKPEGIGKCIGERSHQATSENGNQLCGCHLPVSGVKFAGEMGDGPEKEKYGKRTG